MSNGRKRLEGDEGKCDCHLHGRTDDHESGANPMATPDGHPSSLGSI